MKHLFLDLEQTLIDDWNTLNFMPARVKVVRNIIQSEQPTLFHVFSYAIWDNVDVERYERELRPEIERILSIQLQPVLHVNELIVRAQRIYGCKLNQDDFFSFCGKQTFFPLLCNTMFKDTTCILVDDRIENETINYTSTGNTIKLIRMEA